MHRTSIGEFLICASKLRTRLFVWHKISLTKSYFLPLLEVPSPNVQNRLCLLRRAFSCAPITRIILCVFLWQDGVNVPNIYTKQAMPAAEGVFLCVYNSPNSLRFFCQPTTGNFIVAPVVPVVPVDLVGLGILGPLGLLGPLGPLGPLGE